MDLAIFEAKALAQALTDNGHSVSERTVQRWKKGETAPKPQDIRAIRELLGTMKEAAPPSLEERLSRIELYVQAIAAATPGAEDEIADIDRRVLDLERARQQPDEPRQSGGPGVLGVPRDTER